MCIYVYIYIVIKRYLHSFLNLFIGNSCSADWLNTALTTDFHCKRSVCLLVDFIHKHVSDWCWADFNDHPTYKSRLEGKCSRSFHIYILKYFYFNSFHAGLIPSLRFNRYVLGKQTVVSMWAHFASVTNEAFNGLVINCISWVSHAVL